MVSKSFLDYRENLIVDADDPILALKAMCDRYTGASSSLARHPYLASPHSEDALTGNVYRWLKVHGHAGMIGDCLVMEAPETVLFWGIDCQAPGEHQFALG